MAVANLPFYSTSYGEGFGYNERDGSNTSTFRNRYLNAGYRGTADLGPVRFNATRAQATQNLAMTNTQRPQQAQQQQSQYQQQTQQYQQQTSPQQTQAFRQTQSPQQQQQQQQPTFSQSQQFQPQQQARSQSRGGFEEQQQYQPNSYESEPRGIRTAPAQSQSQQFSRSFGASSSRGNFAPDEEITVNQPPYYIAPYEVPPSNSYAPDATALGNRTYRFNTDSEHYRFRESFAHGAPAVSNKPQQDPGASIPYGRFQAEDAREVRHKMALGSWDTFNAYDRTGATNYNLAGLRTKQQDARADPLNYCKTSISKRLESGAQLRYHLPGYMGYTPTANFRHGATYGKTTRQCLSGSQVGL